MRGIITHVSNMKRSNACTTALKNIPDTLGMDPYLPSIISSRAQIFRDFRGFPTTAYQFSSDAVMTRPKYLKNVNVSIGLP